MRKTGRQKNDTVVHDLETDQCFQTLNLDD